MIIRADYTKQPFAKELLKSLMILGQQTADEGGGGDGGKK